ncbi:DNA repair exonuclease [Corynebacterium diphtheriae]|nr:DNA repair exonuclease [Corynebacterium diphtheriae]
MTVRFLHTSDLQIGMIRRFLDSDAQARFDAHRIAAITKLGEIAAQHDCEFIVMAGDIFEHNSLKPATFGRAMEALKKVPVPVYLLPGNHDPLTADSQLARTEVLDHVHVISHSEPIVIRPGVELVGAPLTAKTATRDLVRLALEPLSPAGTTTRIAVGHGQTLVRDNEMKPDVIDLAFVEQRISEGVIDYLALGDTHSTESLGSTGQVWYSGAPETTDFVEFPSGGGEIDSGNVLMVAIEDHQVSVEKVPVGKWTFEAVTWDINSFDDAQAFISHLTAYSEKENTVVKYALRGTVSMQTMQYLETECEKLRPIFAALYERRRLMDLHLEPREDELDQLGLSGFAQQTLHELVDRDDPVAHDALKLLFRLAKED